MQRPAKPLHAGFAVRSSNSPPHLTASDGRHALELIKVQRAVTAVHSGGRGRVLAKRAGVVEVRADDEVAVACLLVGNILDGFRERAPVHVLGVIVIGMARGPGQRGVWLQAGTLLEVELSICMCADVSVGHSRG